MELPTSLALFEGYVPILFTFVITLTIGSVMIIVSKILGPKQPQDNEYAEVRSSPYECGMDQIQDGARERYSIHFYLVAILFILFDLETVFLFPWAASFKSIEDPTVKLALLAEVLFFVIVLGVGLLYVWKRRGLEWE